MLQHQVGDSSLCHQSFLLFSSFLHHSGYNVTLVEGSYKIFLLLPSVLCQCFDIGGQPSSRAELPPSSLWTQPVSHQGLHCLTQYKDNVHKNWFAFTYSNTHPQACSSHVLCVFGPASPTCAWEITVSEMRALVSLGRLSQQPDPPTKSSCHSTWRSMESVMRVLNILHRYKPELIPCSSLYVPLMTAEVLILFVFQGLRLNRTLLSLSLANNQIGDSGAAHLAVVCIHI